MVQFGPFGFDIDDRATCQGSFEERQVLAKRLLKQKPASFAVLRQIRHAHLVSFPWRWKRAPLPLVCKGFAASRPEPEQPFKQFGAPGPDQTRKTKDLPFPEVKARALDVSRHLKLAHG